MIDEKVLIERLEEYRQGIKRQMKHTGVTTYFIGKDDGYKVAIQDAQQLAEESNNGWIPCDKELPKEYTDVLGCDYEGNIVVVELYTDNVFGKVWRLWNGGDWRFNCIIAWQPLPAPYQQKGE